MASNTAQKSLCEPILCDRCCVRHRASGWEARGSMEKSVLLGGSQSKVSDSVPRVVQGGLTRLRGAPYRAFVHSDVRGSFQL